MTKRTVFRITTLGLVGLIIASGLLACEQFLRFKQERIRRSDQLDPGLVRHDPLLGWVLTPNWTGRHRHHDFDVHYTINASGFRVDPGVDGQSAPRRAPSLAGSSLVAVVGDSFTFGLGVNDGGTFVAQLNRSGTNGFVNCAMPGFSTDQEVLLIEREVLKLEPDTVLVVVCLVNDLFDNARAFPLQVDAAKPHFESTASGLELRNTPVPEMHKPPAEAAVDLPTVVLGPEHGHTLRARLTRRSELFQLIEGSVLPQPDRTAEFETRFRPALDLFRAIVRRLQNDCGPRNARLVLALLAGRSYVEEPSSVSAQYQEVLRQDVLRELVEDGVRVIDLAGPMRRTWTRAQGRWFHPHDGHLTPEGHRVVAKIILGGGVR